MVNIHLAQEVRQFLLLVMLYLTLIARTALQIMQLSENIATIKGTFGTLSFLQCSLKVLVVSR